MEFDALCDECGAVTVTKSLEQPFPERHGCGSKLTRRYSPLSVIYKARGFYSTDVARYEKQVGTQRAREFEAFRDDAERRAKQGRLTGYERRLEELDRADAIRGRR